MLALVIRFSVCLFFFFPLRAALCSRDMPFADGFRQIISYIYKIPQIGFSKSKRFFFPDIFDIIIKTMISFFHRRDLILFSPL